MLCLWIDDCRAYNYQYIPILYDRMRSLTRPEGTESRAPSSFCEIIS
jgi:hypothetical protein